MKKIISFLILAVIGLIFSPAYADLHPGFHALDPAICTPPSPPEAGQPGYGLGNALPNGSYYDPTTGFWYIPDGVWSGEPGARMIEIIEEIQVLTYEVWPYWATSDAWDGKYWYPGGYTNTSHYYSEGYYYPYEIL